MAGPESFLPVIRVITRDDGSSVSPADELRIRSGLTVTYVPGPGVEGPGRIELDAVAAAVLPSISYPFPGFAAGFTKGGPILWGSKTAPTFVTSIDFIPSDDLTHDDTNYAKISVVIIDASGNPLGSPIVQWTTQSYDASTRPLGLGDWTTFLPLIEIAVGYEIATGHSIWWIAEKGGTGQTVPSGSFRIT